MAHREPLSAGLASVVEHACALAAPSERDLVASFVEHFLDEIDDGELASRPAEFAANSVAHLRFGHARGERETLIDVRDAIDAARSLLLVVTDDAPFMVDSMRLALEELGLDISLMIHPWMDVERDASGTLLRVGSGSIREAWTQMEVSHCLPELVADVRAVISEAVAVVQLVVGDSAAMRARAHALAEELADAPAEGHTASEADQVAKLLGWLTRQNFVFLGAAFYTVGDGALHAIDGSQLGLLRAGGAIDPVFAGGDRLVSIARTDAEVRIHRRARPVCIAVRRVDNDGHVVGEERFFGLFSAAAYRASVTTVPLLRERVAWILQRSRFDQTSHTGRALRSVLETFPRDEIFEIGRDELADVAMEIVGLQERAIVRVLELRSPASGWQTLAVFLPRGRLTPEMPQRIAQRIADLTGAERMEVDTFISTSPLARVTVEIRRGDPVTDAELAALSAEVDELSQRWDDRLRNELAAALGSSEGARLAARYVPGMTADYTAVTPPAVAVVDIRAVEALLAGHDPTATTFVGDANDSDIVRRLRIYRRDGSLTLAELLPLLDQLGLQAIDERPSSLTVGDSTISVYDVGVRLATANPAALDEVQATFRQLLAGEIEADGLNRLVLVAGLGSRDVEIVRAYTKYMRQTLFPFSQQYIEVTLAKHARVVGLIVALFRARFALDGGADRAATCAAIQVDLDAALEAIPSLDEDRICRTLGELVTATLRTNAYRPGDGGGKRRVLALKFDPALVVDLPLPRPMFEIWVCSPRVEGVHLRGGRIARGGIRWSDRREDFRTEVLGLMKAQMVKNAVIVPTGSKGGFVVKNPPADGDALRAEVVGCYTDFIGGLLDLTDNIVGGEVVPPPSTVRYDSDDPYLVVAADKGTATF
ncbi:MAG TPA: NAD-glutamate dehydrogenase domain-containing protein, partial [Ilumatobacteraceae bacterium]